VTEPIFEPFKSVCILACAMAAFIAASMSMASDAEVERAALVRLIHELERVEPLIRQAETAAVSTERVQFQYLWLRADLDKIKAGIREYLDAAPITPRVIPPLAGDYIR